MLQYHTAGEVKCFTQRQNSSNAVSKGPTPESVIHTTVQAQFLLQLLPTEQHFPFSDVSMQEATKTPEGNKPPYPRRKLRPLKGGFRWKPWELQYLRKEVLPAERTSAPHSAHFLVADPCISPWLLVGPVQEYRMQCPGKLRYAVLPRAGAQGYTGIGLVLPQGDLCSYPVCPAPPGLLQRQQWELSITAGTTEPLKKASHSCIIPGWETSLGANRSWRFLPSLPHLPLPVYSCLKGKTDFGDCSHNQILTQIILLRKFWAESSHSSTGFNLKIILREKQIQRESQKYPFQQTACLTLSLLRTACRTGLEQCDGSDS